MIAEGDCLSNPTVRTSLLVSFTWSSPSLSNSNPSRNRGETIKQTLKLKMGFLGLLQFALKHFDVLAWFLFSLVYPLCCSIRAIEANSISDTQKLNTYWVVYSLVLLFEHTCMKLLEWLPLWPYIQLMVVVWLVIPHFDGAFYVYKHLICPCLSMDPQILANWFNKKDSLFMRQNFLAEVESYVKENGTEALEKIVACKSETTKSNLDMKCFRAVPSTENKESKPRNNDVAQKDIEAVQVGWQEPNLTETENFKFVTMEIKEKAFGVAAVREILKTPPSKKVQEGKCVINPITIQCDTTFDSHLDSKKHKAAYEAPEIKNQAEPKLNQIENSTFVALETKEKAVEVATGSKVLESSKNVEKEWTCALYQITSCETNLNMHLEGTKHKAAYEALKAKNPAFVPKTAPASTAKKSNQPNEEPGKSTLSSGSKVKVIIHDKVQGQKDSIPPSITENSDKAKKSDQCNEEPGKSTSSSVSKVKVIIQEKVQGQKNSIPGSISKNSDKSKVEPAEGVSSNGLKRNIVINFKGKVQGQQQNPNEVPRMKNTPWRCNVCNLRCPGEIDMTSHLKGRKHKEKVQEVVRKNDPLDLDPLWCKICKVRCTSELDMASHLCGRKHLDNPLWCKICNVTCSSEFDMTSHLRGRKHLHNSLCCKICNVTCSSELQMASHLNGRKHLDNLSAGM